MVMVTRLQDNPIKADSGHLPISHVRKLLREWARWVTWPEPLGPQSATCRSAEHNYRSPQCWDERLPRPIEPDWRIAWRIETIIRTLPATEAKLVRVWYVVLGRQVTRMRPGDDPFELAARRAHVGSARRAAELLMHAEQTIRQNLE